MIPRAVKEVVIHPTKKRNKIFHNARLYPPMNDTAMENSNREQRKNAGIVHPKRGEVPLDSAPASAAKEGKADANDDDDEKKKRR